MSAHPSLKQIFGNNEIGSIVKGFDFSKIDTKDSSKKDYLNIGLAPDYAGLNNQTIKTVDKYLKIAIAGTVNTLRSIDRTNLSWSQLLAIFMRNPLLEPDGPDGVTRSDRFVKNGTHDFKFDGSPDADIVKEVEAWFHRLINNDQVIQSTHIDINVLAQIVAQTGATVDSFLHFFARNEYHEKTMIEIGVLRFPNIDNPHFQIYRIQLTAWSASHRILFHQEDSNGITGVYNSRIFKPRKSVIYAMKAEVIPKAAKEAEDLFADIH